jgi:hypothetical protein
MTAQAISIYGHIVAVDDGMPIECEECELSLDVPDIIEQSSGFVEVLYKLHIFGELKKESCSVDVGVYDEIDDTVLDVGPPDNNQNKPIPKPGRVRWSDGSPVDVSRAGYKISADGEQYEYMGGNEWRNMNTDTIKTMSALVLEHGSGTILSQVPDDITERAATVNSGTTLPTNNIRPPQAGSDWRQQNNPQVTVSHTIQQSDDDDESLKESMVGKLSKLYEL